MVVVKAKKIPKKYRDVSPEDVLALFCYHYQQYTYAAARKLPYKRIRHMLKIAEREYAKKMFDYLQIIASPHTKKMSGIKQLIDYYKDIIDQ